MAPKPPELAGLKEPIVGYLGGIHRWIDFELVKGVARRHPDYSFVFVGPIQTDIGELQEEQNIFFIGQKPREKLPHYVRHFAACLIPYKIAPYTENVYPTKLNEYLATGKPVLSTPLAEILNFNRSSGNIVEVAETVDEFNNKLTKVLKEGEQDSEKINRRIEIALKNSWTVKIEQMSLLIEERLKKNFDQQQAHWRENLINLYRTARRELVKTAVVGLGCYLLVFHTPLLWWVAEPLRQSDPLVRSDLIAVLGGGVGESGLAGEGYQERVKQGVDLLKAGYADTILFLSGYRYSFQEVEVMKALAVDLGVTKDRILLEKRPSSTYDHLIKLRETLQKQHFYSVIIVSSPYHMRRVTEVVQKVLPEYKVSLAPVEHSQFFGDRSSVKVRHIRAILHEYLALIYYAYKGYI